MAKGNRGQFKIGHKGGPGRPPVILPELQRVIDGNRNAVRAMIIQMLEPRIEGWLKRIIEQGHGEGDLVRLKGLLEIALGKMVDEPKEEPITDEERALLVSWRKRKAEQAKIE